MKRINRQRGVLTIEFAVGFIAFWLMIVAWIEVGYVSYVSALNDLAINKAAQAAKKGETGYLEAYESVLNDQNSIWNSLIDVDRVQYSVRYVKDVATLAKVTENCLPDPDEEDQTTATCGTEADSAIAIYQMSYQFNGIFTDFLADNMTAAREVIVIQEYERDKFNF